MHVKPVAAIVLRGKKDGEKDGHMVLQQRSLKQIWPDPRPCCALRSIFASSQHCMCHIPCCVFAASFCLVLWATFRTMFVEVLHMQDWGQVWANLGQVGRNWGQIRAKLGPSWIWGPTWGPSWGQVGAKLGQVGPSWGQVGAKLGPSWAKLAIQRVIIFLCAFWIDFGRNLVPIWLQLGSQNQAKMEPSWSQNRSKLECSFGSYFWMDVGYIFYSFATNVKTAEVCKNSKNIVSK